MSSDDGRFQLVFNGEIYNYRELRAELETLGHRFRSAGDTEVLLAAYQQWETAALTRFTGMFAFAVLDTERRILLLARDCFGIKPLYYSKDAGSFAFASEIKALLALTSASPKINAPRLYDYLRFGVTDHTPQTLFEGVLQVPPAHFLRVRLDDPSATELVRFWSMPVTEPIDLSFEEAASTLRDMFLKSISLHMRSDVPIGAALSGGIDSSSIVCSMRAACGEPLEIHAVSYFAEDADINEEKWVTMAAAAARARVQSVLASADSLADDLDRLIDVQEEPFGSTSIYPQYCVFRRASQIGLKVMLDGQGADELLGGYRYHFAGRLVSLLSRLRWVAACRLYQSARRLPGSPGPEVLDSLAFHLLPETVHGIARRVARKPFFPAWLQGPWFATRIDVGSPIQRVRGKDALRSQMLAALNETSLPMLLHWEDRNSMAFSIESRVPFLTTDLATFVFSLPAQYVVAENATGKAVFRAAMRGIVPDAILHRLDKIGFASPELHWLTHLRTWVDDILAGETARRIPALDLQAARDEWSAISRGERRFDWHVWRWINLIRWSDRFDVSFDV
jgi:asparagine synthase (glutamine-hydrolysing)